mmetsp:Transcript_2175/g.4280  ORF Transcript_2175/g.4280 Transcript_2175/m.4280 type:complete len:346 (+) Transcript_2175:363-1400(+)|eukprot:scaffold37610_cov252-Amphora_coffeaeformis.AAC.1
MNERTNEYNNNNADCPTTNYMTTNRIAFCIPYTPAASTYHHNDGCCFFPPLFLLSWNVSDLSLDGTIQIPTKANVTGHLPHPGAWPPVGNQGLEAALKGAKVVVIPAGVPRKPGMTRDDLFAINAGIVKTLVEGCAQYCPEAVLAIISNPVNSTVPIAAEVMKQAGVYNPAKVCGVTTLDVIRANTFVAGHMGVADPGTMGDVPVIGGHAGTTILPLFSQVPGFSATDAELEALTVRTQFGGDEVVKAKAGAGSATLSMAYAGYLFTEKVLKAMKGETGIVQAAYVESTLTEAPFFASLCEFGPDGVSKVLPYGTLSPYEQQWFDKMMPDLKKQIQKGVDFATSK